MTAQLGLRDLLTVPWQQDWDLHACSSSIRHNRLVAVFAARSRHADIGMSTLKPEHRFNATGFGSASQKYGSSLHGSGLASTNEVRLGGYLRTVLSAPCGHCGQDANGACIRTACHCRLMARSLTEVATTGRSPPPLAVSRQAHPRHRQLRCVE